MSKHLPKNLAVHWIAIGSLLSIRILSTPTFAAELTDQTTRAVHYPNMMQVSFSLMFVTLILLGGLYMLKRLKWMPGYAQSDDMKIVSSIYLNNRDKIMLISVRGHEFLVGHSPGTIQAIATLSKHAQVNVSTENFERVLDKKQHEVTHDE